MLKKTVFVVALVAMMVPATFGRDYLHADGTWSGNSTTVSDQPKVNWEYDGASSERKAESWNWPATYDSQDICVIPVKLDVGFWIKVNGCKDLVINLKQVSIHKYSGSTDVSITCNVNLKLSVSWSKASNINLGGYGHSESVNPSTLDAPGGTVTVTQTLTDVDLAELVKGFPNDDPAKAIPGQTAGANCVTVGSLTLRVRPNVTPVLAGGCG
jgi:hypothetical protein